MLVSASGLSCHNTLTVIKLLVLLCCFDVLLGGICDGTVVFSMDTLLPGTDGTGAISAVYIKLYVVR
jgi:hypothetical protein